MGARHDEPLHMKLLRRRVEINRADRERDEKLRLWLEGRVKEIKNAPERVRTSFFCDQCDADWDGPGYKQVRWPTYSLWYAYYIGYCPKRHPCVRRITDKFNDPYFYKSYIIRKEQARMSDDLLPDWHPRFKYVYPKQWAEMQARER